jgi:quinol monooxygenase YgiN
MELFIFVRFHAVEGREDEVATAIRDVITPSRAEPGCVAIEAFRATRDSKLFYIHSRWIDEAAFEIHAGFPHTVQFIQRVQLLVDHPVEVIRTRPLG